MALRTGLVLAIALGLSATAVASTAQRPVYQPPQAYYLALGDSMAYGFQPGKGFRPATFDKGYVDVFAAKLRKLSPKIQVVNYSCPGETTVTFAKGGCDWLAGSNKLHDAFRGSQLAAALAFLKAHRGQVSPITVTLWGAELAPLSAKGKQAPKLIASVASRLETILEQLRAAAPTAEIIVSGAWNPEANALAKTTPLYRSVDKAIRRAAAASRARVADMFAAYNSGTLAAQQARLCALTYICKAGDPHPNDAGYRKMADAFMKASGYPLKP